MSVNCLSVVVYIYYTCSLFISERHDSVDTCMLKLQIVHRKLQAFALSPWHFGTRLEQPLQRRQALYYPLLLQEHPRARTLYCSLASNTRDVSHSIALFFLSLKNKQTQRTFLCTQYVKDKATFSFTPNSTGRGGVRKKVTDRQTDRTTDRDRDTESQKQTDRQIRKL